MRLVARWDRPARTCTRNCIRADIYRLEASFIAYRNQIGFDCTSSTRAATPQAGPPAARRDYTTTH